MYRSAFVGVLGGIVQRFEITCASRAESPRSQTVLPEVLQSMYAAWNRWNGRTVSTLCATTCSDRLTRAEERSCPG